MSVHRTVDGVAHHLAGHAPAAKIEGGVVLTIEDLDAALDRNAVVRVMYEGAQALVVERHVVNV